MRFTGRRSNVLFTVAIVLLGLWLLGLMTSQTAGGAIHLLLVIAIIIFVARYI